LIFSLSPFAPDIFVQGFTDVSLLVGLINEGGAQNPVHRFPTTCNRGFPMPRTSILLKSIALLLLVVGLTGCDTFEDLNPFNDEKGVQGVIEQIGDNSLTLDGIAYAVTDQTEFEGDLSGLADLSVGDEVEIEYEENGSNRTALEVELASADDDD